SKSINEVAKEVINGKWGNGSDRTNRLAAAGYDAKAVQNEVNRILR
ncbi:N-acetylmuramoyl-L-alanine amidase, partial [bacterium 210702-DFI.5.13]|nr:N-acetylmuramoyl-L-alanine amidase [bacterium 210702-DFI.5.13]